MHWHFQRQTLLVHAQPIYCQSTSTMSRTLCTYRNPKIRWLKMQDALLRCRAHSGWDGKRETLQGACLQIQTCVSNTAGHVFFPASVPQNSLHAVRQCLRSHLLLHVNNTAAAATTQSPPPSNHQLETLRPGLLLAETCSNTLSLQVSVTHFW